MDSNKIKIMLAGMLVFCGVHAQAMPPELTITKIDMPPVIDGQLTDPAWESAGVATPFVLPDGQAADADTKGYICYDADNLYIAFRCDEPHPAGIKTDAQKSQEVWGEMTWWQSFSGRILTKSYITSMP